LGRRGNGTAQGGQSQVLRDPGRTFRIIDDFGLFFTAVFVAFIMPTATNKWTFTIESWVVGFVEGICLVATPALIRDFSPQVGRATAMGFWTSGPVIGSLIVSVVGTATIPAVINDERFWTHEYRICGIAGLIEALRKRAESHPNLAAYCERSMRRFYPEFVKRAA